MADVVAEVLDAAAGPVTFRLGGEFAVPDVESFAPTVAPFLGARRDVIIDLTDVTFLDSSGIAALVTTRQQVLGYGGQFELRGVSSRARRVLEVSGLAPLFDLT